MLSPSSRLSQRKINEDLLISALNSAPLIPLTESDLSRTDAVTRARSNSDDSEDVITPKMSNSKQALFFESSPTQKSPFCKSVKYEEEKLPLQILHSSPVKLPTNNTAQESIEQLEEVATDNEGYSDPDPNRFLNKCIASLKLKTLTHEQHVEAMNNLHNLWVKQSKQEIEKCSVSSQGSVDSGKSDKSVSSIQYLEQELVLLRQQSKMETDMLRKELEEEKQKALLAQEKQLERTKSTSEADEISALREEYEQEATVFMEGVRRECHEAQEKAVKAALKEKEEELGKAHEENLSEALALQELKLKEQHDETLANALDQTRVLLQKRHSTSLQEMEEKLEKKLEDQQHRLEAEKQQALNEYREKTEKNRSELIGDAVAKFVETNKKIVQEHKTELEKLKIEHAENLSDEKQKLEGKLSTELKARDDEIKSLRERLRERLLEHEVSPENHSPDNTTGMDSPKVSRNYSRPSRIHFDKLHRLQSEREKVLRDAIGKINETLEHKHQDQNLLLDQKVQEVSELEEEIKRIESKHLSHVKDLREKFDKEKEALTEKHECEICEIKAKMDLAADEARDAASRCVELEEKHGQNLQKVLDDHRCEVTSLQNLIDQANLKSCEEEEHLSQALESFTSEKHKIMEEHKHEISELQHSTDVALTEGREESSRLQALVDNLKHEKEQVEEQYCLKIDEIKRNANAAVSEARLESSELAHQMQLLAEQHSNEIKRLKKSLEEAANEADNAAVQLRKREEDFELKHQQLLNEKEKELRIVRQSSDDVQLEQVARAEQLESDFIKQREKFIAEHEEEVKKLESALEDAATELRNEKKRYAQVETDFIREKNDILEHHKIEIKNLQYKLEAAVASIDKDVEITSSSAETTSLDKRNWQLGRSDEEVLLANKEAIKMTEERLRREFECEISKADKDVQQIVKKAVDDRTKSLCGEFQEQLRAALTAKRMAEEETRKQERDSQVASDQAYLKRISELETALDQAQKRITANEQQILKDIDSNKAEGERLPNKNAQLRIAELESKLLESGKAWKEEKTALENRHFAKLEMFRRSHQVQLRRAQDRAKALERSKALELANLKTEQKMTEVANTTELNLRVQELMRKNMAETSRFEELLNEAQEKAALYKSELANQQKITEKMTLALSNKEDELAEVRECMNKLSNDRENIVSQSAASSKSLTSTVTGRVQKDEKSLAGESSSIVEESTRVTSKEKRNGTFGKENQKSPVEPGREILTWTHDDRKVRLCKKNSSSVELTKNNEIELENLGKSKSWETPCSSEESEENFECDASTCSFESSPDLQSKPGSDNPETGLLPFSTRSYNRKVPELKTPVRTKSSSETLSTSELTSSTRQSRASMSRRSNTSESPLRSSRRLKSLPQSSFRVQHLSEIDQSQDGMSSNNAATIKVLLTCPTTPLLIQMVGDLGAELIDTIDEAHSATHVVIGETLRRTPKLMIALCVTSNIVTIDWLLNSHRSNQVLPSSQYLCLKDKRAEKRYNFSMKRTLNNGVCNRENGGLLNGWSVIVADGVAGLRAPPKNELDLILQAAGATVVEADEVQSSAMRNKSLVITSDPPTLEQVTFVNRIGLRTATASWLFDCIMHQKLTGLV